jgi:choline-sulfatase
MPAPPLPAQLASLLGAATIAALLGAVPATVRVAHDGGGPLRAWIGVSASALVPMIVLVGFARSAREGARSITGDEAPLVTWAIGAWAIATFLALAAFGAVLRATTHHHGLAGVTFAMGGLVVGGAMALVVRRLTQMARDADPWGRTGLVVCVMGALVCALLTVVIRVARSGGAEVPPATLVDVIAFVVAGYALSRQAFARIGWLSVSGIPLAVGVLALGWSLLSREPPLVEAIRAHAPLLGAMATRIAAVAGPG